MNIDLLERAQHLRALSSGIVHECDGCNTIEEVLGIRKSLWERLCNWKNRTGYQHHGDTAVFTFVRAALTESAGRHINDGNITLCGRHFKDVCPTPYIPDHLCEECLRISNIVESCNDV